MTVIRLVNDAVDTIESEGTMSHSLCVSPLAHPLFFYPSLVIAVSLLKEVISYRLKLNTVSLCVKYYIVQ